MRKDVKIQANALSIKATVNENIQIRVERNYFLVSKRDLCVDFIGNSNPDELEILDALLNLHFVLEVGINAFFRNYYKHCSNYDFLGVTSKDIDSVDFLSKTVLFINSNKFNLSNFDEVQSAHTYAKNIPKKIKSFNEIRNMIVHGHTVSEVSGIEINESSLKSKIKPDTFKKQASEFRAIMSGLIFFIDRIETEIPRDQIDMFKNNYLSTSFLD